MGNQNSVLHLLQTSCVTLGKSCRMRLMKIFIIEVPPWIWTFTSLLLSLHLLYVHRHYTFSQMTLFSLESETGKYSQTSCFNTHCCWTQQQGAKELNISFRKGMRPGRMKWQMFLSPSLANLPCPWTWCFSRELPAPWHDQTAGGCPTLHSIWTYGL